MKKLVIAIDGPAASGKSTTSKLIAKRLGYLHVDTGAMYRAMTLKVLQENIGLDDVRKIAELAAKTSVRLEQQDDQYRVFLDNADVTRAIRGQAVTRAVSAVSMIPEVRDAMVREQRRMGKSGGIILEGRDIGTVVFPDADLKIFMVANLEARARRRRKELEKEGMEIPLDQVIDEILERDNKDSARPLSPLRRAEDAVIVDTSNMTIAEQVEFIVAKANALMECR